MRPSTCPAGDVRPTEESDGLVVSPRDVADRPDSIFTCGDSQNLSGRDVRHHHLALTVHNDEALLDGLPDKNGLLGLADVLVTEESSVMVEALLLGIPVVAVTDWLIPDRNPPRPTVE